MVSFWLFVIAVILFDIAYHIRQLGRSTSKDDLDDYNADFNNRLDDQILDSLKDIFKK